MYPTVITIGLKRAGKPFGIKMETLWNENPIPFDVDGTLVTDNFGRWAPDHPDLIDIEINGTVRTVMPVQEHIELLKMMKAEKKYIIVWSQAGVKWAHKVIQALGLEDYVDLCMMKPMGYVDDNPAHRWLERAYVRPAVLDTTLKPEGPTNPLYEELDLYKPVATPEKDFTVCQFIEGGRLSFWTSEPHCPCGSRESYIQGDKQICTHCGKERDVPRF